MLFSISIARGTQIIIINVSVNQESKGDFFVGLTDDGDFLVKIEDLGAMGIREPLGEKTEMNGEKYLSLRSIEGLDFHFDEQKLLLEITARPSLLGNRIIDFAPSEPANVIHTDDPSAFFNYRLDYSVSHPSDLRQFNLTGQLGANYNRFLFLTDSVYSKIGENDRLVRLMTSVTHDRRLDFERIVVGDFFAQSGEMGTALNLGGFSYSKNYAIDPYFIKQPRVNFSGAAALPTEMEVYLDGTPIRRERIAPGEFQLKNISPRAGAGSLEVVLTDPFGNQERIQYPFYLADALLKQGLQEYSYNFGFIRERFGEESFQYGDPAFSAFHRYGVRDGLTAGFNAEATQDRALLGMSASVLAREKGVVSLSWAASRNEESQGGLGAAVGYAYQGKRLSARVALSGNSADFVNLGTGAAAPSIKYQAEAGLGYGEKRFGFLNLDYRITQPYAAQTKRDARISYSRILTPTVSLFTTAERAVQEKVSYDFFIGLQYYPGQDTSLSTRYEKSGEVQTETAQAQKNAPIGEGYGGRALVERSETGAGSIDRLESSLQYNLKYGIYAGEYRQAGSERATQISAAGGIAYIGRTIRLGRPINDSFGLVKVGSLPGVRVYNNNQEIGKTDSSGELLIPEMGSYYDNQISINDRDVPLSYTMKETQRVVSPALRSGAYIPFEVKKFQAVSGRILINLGDRIAPVEFQEARLVGEKSEKTFPTGKGGEFYIEDVDPGVYKVSYSLEGRRCSFDLEAPASDETLVDLGEFVCEANR